MSTCISRHGEYVGHAFPAPPGPVEPIDDYCQRCGALNDDRPAQQVAHFQAKIKELEQKNREIVDDSINTLNAGYEQCLQDMADVVGITQEVTRVLGPAEGLTYLLERLQEKDIVIGHRRGVPHDWLSRWKVELA